MTDKETLERAIQKAIASGWNRVGLTDEGEMHFTDGGIVVDWLRGGRDFVATETIIFNHDFAKALWGEEEVTTAWELKDGGERILNALLTAYKHHLMQMVVADDPIKYLGENI